LKSRVQELISPTDQSKNFPKVPGELERQVGTGAMEGWRKKLTERLLAIVEEYAGEILANFGYPPGLSNPTAKTHMPSMKRKQWNVSNMSIRRPGNDRRFSNISSVDHQLKMDPKADRLFRVHVGGRIANFFSRYRY